MNVKCNFGSLCWHAGVTDPIRFRCLVLDVGVMMSSVFFVLFVAFRFACASEGYFTLLSLLVDGMSRGDTDVVAETVPTSANNI